MTIQEHAHTFVGVADIELEIEDIAFGGKGVGRSGGKVVFVPFTIEGEQVRARIVREKKQFAEAQLETVLEASPHRVDPPCPYFTRCGGCSYQHIDYAQQLALKTKQVAQALRRIARIENPPLEAIVPSPKPYQYRNRITVHAQDGVVGYFRRDVHRLLDVKYCPIAQPEVNEALAQLRARRPRDGHYTLRAQSGPRVFSQTNDEVGEALAKLVAEILSAGGEFLIDAYCGAGFFSKRLASKFQRVLGIEWDRYAIRAAQESAAPNETYLAGDVEVELAAHLGGATAVIVDPPATGLSGATRKLLRDHPPVTLIYVACDPTTLARDLKELREVFVLKSLTPLDMFPQTAEIECVAHLEIRPLAV